MVSVTRETKGWCVCVFEAGRREGRPGIEALRMRSEPHRDLEKKTLGRWNSKYKASGTGKAM
jgi:hypothetical protein